MNELQRAFEYQGSQIRTVIKDGEPWFVAKDVCDVLGLGNSREAVSKLDSEEKGAEKVDTLGGPQEMTVIAESGLYTLIIRSNMPEAKPFRKWVTYEVLPSIRKTGSYAQPQYKLPATFSECLRMLADKVEENQILTPKAQQFDNFMTGRHSQPVGVVAKALGTGRTKLFSLLRDQKILMRNNTPYQNYMERGYFEVIERTVVMGGETINKPQTLVTAKGVDYIGKLMARCEIDG